MIQKTLTKDKPIEFMRFISVYEDDKNMLNAFDKIYLKSLGFGLDPTYSKGNIYGNGKQPKIKFDLKPQTNDTKQSDCRKLPLENISQKSIVFDPPFLFRNDFQRNNRKEKNKNEDINCKRFSYFQDFDELMKMYIGSLKEFYRILEDYGILIFKCQDMTDGSGSRPFYDTHCEIISKAREIGFSLKDIGIIVKKNKIIKKAKEQGCLRKVHCYYLVFRKEKCIEPQLNETEAKS